MALPEKPHDVEIRTHYEREALLAISRALSLAAEVYEVVLL